MKIQNKSARIWISVGLIGLILFGVRSVIGPFGGVIVEMLSDAGIIFLIIGWYLESRSKKRNEQKGFIPLAVALVIGIIALAGGTTAIILARKAPVAGPEAPGTALGKALEVRDDKTDIGAVKRTVSQPAPQQEKVVKTESNSVVEEKKQAPETITPAKAHPGITYIDAFLNNPTPESLKAFCTVAKSMEGYSEEKVFNADRTGYEMKKKSLYQEAGAFCSLALGEMPGSENYSWTYYSESYLLPLTDQGESDDLRKKKIEYNTLISGIPPSKLFAYDKSLAGTEHSANTPREMVEGMLNVSIYSRFSRFKMYLKASIIVPEKKLKEVREHLIQI